jgi:hypothetical protein
LVPRVEKVASQLKVVQGTRAVPWIMIDIDDAERFVNEGRSAVQVFPGGRIITTSTVHDRILSGYHLDRELKVVRSFEPAFHVPSDRPVYQEDNREERLWFIEKMVEGTLALRDGLAGTGIQLLPLIKGMTPEEWQRAHDPLAQEGFTAFSFYGKQYFGGGVGKRDLELTSTVRALLSTCSIRYLLLIGYQSDRRVPDLPSSVRAFAGQRWRSYCKVGTATAARSRQFLEDLVAASRDRHGTRQEVLVQSRAADPVEVE